MSGANRDNDLSQGLSNLVQTGEQIVGAQRNLLDKLHALVAQQNANAPSTPQTPATYKPPALFQAPEGHRPVTNPATPEKSSPDSEHPKGAARRSLFK